MVGMSTDIHCELDFHADTCCFGSNVLLLSQDLSLTAEVIPFMADLGHLTSVPIVSVAVDYDCQSLYQTFILIFHQVFYNEQLERALLCPNQLRFNDIEVNDCPLMFLPSHLRTDRSHTIITPQLRIPLQLNGVISYFICRKPTIAEMQDSDRFPRIEMTSEGPWTPDAEYRRSNEWTIRASVATQYEVAALNVTPHVSSDFVFDFHLSVINLAAVQATRRKGTVTSEALAKRWFIGVETARRTIDQTTQLAVRDFTSTQGSR
jgi:hypothetical protein